MTKAFYPTKSKIRAFKITKQPCNDWYSKDVIMIKKVSKQQLSDDLRSCSAV